MIARSLSSRAADLPLSAAAGRPVVVDADQLVGRILLRHNTIRVVMGVFVALRIAQRRGARIVAVTQMRRHQPGLAGFDVGHRRTQRGGHGVRLGRGGQVHGGVRQGQLGFGHADQLHGLRRGDRGLQRVGSAMPMSSLARITSRRAMNRGSSPATSMRAR